MKMMMGMIVCVTLSACATAPLPPVPAAPVQPAPPPVAPVIPVGLDGLRGSQALIFPDIDVPTTVAAIEGYTARCLADRGLRRIGEPHGFSLLGEAGAPYLRVIVASVSESSALGLGGTGLTDAMKEAIADTVRGRPRCAP